MNRHILKLTVAVLMTFALLAANAQLWAAPSASTISTLTRILSRHGDEAADLGRMAKTGGRVLSAAERNDWVTRLPALANKSDDVIAGLKVIDDFAQQGPKQARLIDAMDNPIRLLQMERGAQGTWRVVDEAADILSVTRRMPDTGLIKGASPDVFRRAEGLFGNYGKSADAFMDMAARGGKKSVEVAGKLLTVIKNNPKFSAVVGLVAWHMVDPEGAKKAVNDFFNSVGETAGNVIDAAAESTQDAAAGAMDRILNKAWSNLKERPAAMILSVVLVLIIFVQPIRKTVALVIGLPFTVLNKKLEAIANKGVDVPPAKAKTHQKSEQPNSAATVKNADSAKIKASIYGDGR